MTKGLWKIVGLGGISAVIAIAAFAFDSKEEKVADCVADCQRRNLDDIEVNGERRTCEQWCTPQAENPQTDAIEQADANLTTRACSEYCGGPKQDAYDLVRGLCMSTCLDSLARGEHRSFKEKFEAWRKNSMAWRKDIMRRDQEAARVAPPVDHEASTALQEEIEQRDEEETEAEHNPAPEKFRTTPELGALLESIPRVLHARSEIFWALYEAYVQEHLAVSYAERGDVPMSRRQELGTAYVNQLLAECAAIYGEHDIMRCLDHAAEDLENFRSAARREEDDEQEVTRMEYTLVPRALADFPIPPEIEAQANVCSGIGGVLRCRVLPLLVIVSPTIYWCWSDLQTTYVLQPGDSTAADIPYGPHWYGPDGTPMSDPPQPGTVREEN